MGFGIPFFCSPFCSYLKRFVHTTTIDTFDHFQSAKLMANGLLLLFVCFFYRRCHFLSVGNFRCLLGLILFYCSQIHTLDRFAFQFAIPIPFMDSAQRFQFISIVLVITSNYAELIHIIVG